MDALLRKSLLLRKTDVDGAIHRCCDNEQFYMDCLRSFLDDPTMCELERAIEAQAWDVAFTAAHALKGLAGNLGFVPLMHAIGQLVVLIRGGRTHEVAETMQEIQSCYRDIVDAIQQSLRC